MLEDLLGTDALNTDEAIATANQLRRKLLKNYKSLADPNFDFTKLKDLEVKDIITELDLIGSAYSDLATKSINIDTYDIAKAKEALQYLSIAIPIAAGATVVSEKQGGIVNKY
jgi:hypothetical protein